MRLQFGCDLVLVSVDQNMGKIGIDLQPLVIALLIDPTRLIDSPQHSVLLLHPAHRQVVLTSGLGVDDIYTLGILIVPHQTEGDSWSSY